MTGSREVLKHYLTLLLVYMQTAVLIPCVFSAEQRDYRSYVNYGWKVAISTANINAGKLEPFS
jgi:hypothetical protein